MKTILKMNKYLILVIIFALVGIHAYAQGGKGKFITNYSDKGQDEIRISTGVSFVRDGNVDRYAWKPNDITQGDYNSLGEQFDIKNVKTIFRYVESDNQFTVAIPSNAPVSLKDVIVQSYGKEIDPTENNIYSTGANSVSILNKNGKIIYDCYISVDTLNAQRSIEVNALETAFSLLIPLFPFALDPASDEILSTLKTLLIELPETHALAEAIDRSIVKNGYLEIDDVNAEFEAAVDRIIEKLGLRDNYLKQSSKSVRSKRISQFPTVVDGKTIYGLELKLDNSEWHTASDKKWWQCFFTAYNSNRFAYTGWTKGYKDSQGYAHLYDIDYNLLKDRILKPQRVSTFMKNFTTWDGLKNYWGDTYDLLFTENFGFDDMTWDCTKKSFDMDFYSSSEIVVVLGPADDDTMLLYNLIRTFLDPILKKIGKAITNDDDHLMSFIVDLITDTNYMYEFHEIVNKNSSLGVNAKAFVKLTWPKAKKHLIDYFKDELDTKTLQYVWDKWGFMAAGELQKAFEEIDENWNFWLKKVEFWGDMFLGDIGLYEGNHYYNLALDFNIEQNLVTKESFIANGVKFDMVKVDGGTYQMGATDNDKEASSNEKPRHQVSVGDFYIGETEVTQGLWKAVMGSNPSHFNGTELPVENVSWLDCQEFITKLNTITGNNFRLPTEAEWEYAARGGQNSLGYKYSGAHNLNTVGWYEKNSEKGTHPVRWKQANELGLYDMSGNVFEWCQDFYDASYYKHSPKNDPCNDVVASLYAHVLRGGCWHWDDKYCRVSSRSSNGQGVKSEIIGLRLALSEVSTPQPTIKVSPTTLVFDDVEVNKFGRNKLIISNTGTTMKQVKVEVPSSFAIEEAELGDNYKIYNVSGNSSQDVYILFYPQAEKTYQGNITITSDGLEGGKMTVPVSGKGINASNIPLKLSTNTLTLTTGQQGTVNITSGSGSYAAVSNATNVATVTVEGSKLIIKAVAKGTATITVKDNQTQERAKIEVTVKASGTITPGTAIDLGLPSGTLWASCNVGATKPEDFGNYYAWGETEEKDYYYWNNYMCEEAECGTTKDPIYTWNGNKLYADIAGSKFDVATSKWGSSWHMPSSTQMDELLNECIWTWCDGYKTKYNGTNVKGYIISSKVNNNKIFLPAAGNYHKDELLYKNESCLYWSSSQFDGSPFEGEANYTNSNSAMGMDYNNKATYTDLRYYGQTIRPVMNAQQPTIQTETITIPGTNVSFKMVAVEGGTFWMGNSRDISYCGCIPRHQVTLSSFSIGLTEVTSSLWWAVMGTDYHYDPDDEDLPIAGVCWDDCQKFITKLNQLTGRKFRLPTEAEWEFAARGGNMSRGYDYAGSNEIDDVAWWWGNSHNRQPVATKAPNELGLYDMSGNVWEWCQDWYDENYYYNSPRINPQGPDSGSARVRRSGGVDWATNESCWVVFRGGRSPSLEDYYTGLRLALSEAWGHPSDGGDNGPSGGDDGL